MKSAIRNKIRIKKKQNRFKKLAHRKIPIPLLAIKVLTITLMSLSKIYHRFKKTRTTELALDHQGLSSIQAIENLDKYTQLQTLRLDGNALLSFNGIKSIKTLERLYLQNNQIQSLEDFPILPQLRVLNLSSNRLDSIPQLNLPVLLDLDLGGNNLTVRSLYNLPKSVKILNLRNNQLTDLNQVLLTLSQLGALETLDIVLNPFVEGNPGYEKILVRSIPTLRILNGQNVQQGSPPIQTNFKRSYKLKYERLTQHPKPKHFQVSNTILPNKVDLINLSPAFSPQNWPVWDQGNLGSCTAFATLSTIHYYDLTTQPSTLFQYYNERLQDGDVNSDDGSTLSQATQCLIKYGYCTAENWPYDPSQFATQPPQTCYDQALQNLVGKDLAFESIDYSQETIMQRLAQNCPIVMGISVYESFESEAVATTGHVPMPQPNEQLLGGHAVCIVGYDTTTQKWKVRNSWGPNWGDNGYFYLPFNYISEGQLASDLWSTKQGFVVDENISLETRPSAPSLSVSLQPGSPRDWMTSEGNHGHISQTKLRVNKPIISLLAIDEAALNDAIERAVQSLPSIETVITSVIGILTLIQQIIQDILTISSSSGTQLTLDQKGQLVSTCARPIIASLVQKKMISSDLARRAIAQIKKLAPGDPVKIPSKWWNFKSRQQIETLDSNFGIILSN